MSILKNTSTDPGDLAVFMCAAERPLDPEIICPKNGKANVEGSTIIVQLPRESTVPSQEPALQLLGSYLNDRKQGVLLFIQNISPFLIG